MERKKKAGDFKLKMKYMQSLDDILYAFYSPGSLGAGAYQSHSDHRPMSYWPS